MAIMGNSMVKAVGDHGMFNISPRHLKRTLLGAPGIATRSNPSLTEVIALVMLGVFTSGLTQQYIIGGSGARPRERAGGEGWGWGGRRAIPHGHPYCMLSQVLCVSSNYCT